VKTLVLDASVAVKWQLNDEEHADKADAIKQAFVREAIALIVPTLFAVEWANAINMAIIRGRRIGVPKPLFHPRRRRFAQPPARRPRAARP
jgi:predicted nucleic acid-binding protein